MVGENFKQSAKTPQEELEEAYNKVMSNPEGKSLSELEEEVVEGNPGFTLNDVASALMANVIQGFKDGGLVPPNMSYYCRNVCVALSELKQGSGSTQDLKF